MMIRTWGPVFVLAWVGMTSACAPRSVGGSPAPAGTVTVTVANPSPSPDFVTLCAPVGCGPAREIRGEREAEFSFSPSGGTRAVVTARRGDRVVDQRPVDFIAGQRYRVVLDVP